MSRKSKPSGVSITLLPDLKKRGQLTLFVFIAILLVVMIFVYFFWIQPTYFSTHVSGLNFDECVMDSTREAITELSLVGGEVRPVFYYMYQDNKIPYYCYTNEAYKTCIVQQPMVKQYFEERLVKHFGEKVNVCYENALLELRDKGYNVAKGTVRVNLTIIPDKVNIEVLAPTTIGTQRFENFRMAIDSNLYDILMVATSILQYEASYGDSPTSELMYYYPELIVDKIRRGDGTKVYVITDKATEDKFQFASKSLVWPAGYDLPDG